MKECIQCCREIKDEEFKNNNGLCKICYALEKEDSENESNNDTDRKNNIVSIILKVMSIICVIVGIALGLNQLNSWRTEELCGIYIAIGIALAILIYAFGEVVQLLEDIKNK